MRCGKCLPTWSTVRSPSPADPAGERGSVTAEFATVVPAVMLVLACCLGGLQLAGQQLRLQDAAATASRSLARGEGVGAATARVAQLVSGATLIRNDRVGMVCVRLLAPGPAGPFAALTVGASSCALAAVG